MRRIAELGLGWDKHITKMIYIAICLSMLALHDAWSDLANSALLYIIGGINWVRKKMPLVSGGKWCPLLPLVPGRKRVSLVSFGATKKKGVRCFL